MLRKRSNWYPWRQLWDSIGRWEDDIWPLFWLSVLSIISVETTIFSNPVSQADFNNMFLRKSCNFIPEIMQKQDKTIIYILDGTRNVTNFDLNVNRPSQVFLHILKFSRIRAWFQRLGILTAKTQLEHTSHSILTRSIKHNHIHRP